MTSLHKSLFLMCMAVLAVAPVTAQSAACPTIVDTALTQTDAVCKDIGRNQACYGHTALTAEPMFADPNFSFAQEGDIVGVNSLRSMQLSPLDAIEGTWGVALLRIQANLPDTLPGQNVTMLLFGDTQITNAVNPPTFLDVTANNSVNVYNDPDQASAVVNSIATGQAVMATARTSNTNWLRVQLLDGTSGWVPARVMQSSGDLNFLNVVDVGQPAYQPMQAFYLRTGVGEPGCAEVPSNGILVQTPEGARTINLAINNVQVEMGSTLFFTAQAGDQMVVNIVEGAALVDVNDELRPAVAGGRVRIPIDENLNPDGAPSSFEPYDDAAIAPLPIGQLERPIEIIPAVTQDDADLVNLYEAYFEQINVEDYDILYRFLIENKDVLTEEMVRQFVAQLGGKIVQPPPPQEEPAITQPDVEVFTPPVEVEPTQEVIAPVVETTPEVVVVTPVVDDQTGGRDTTGSGDDVQDGGKGNDTTRGDDTQNTSTAGDNTDAGNDDSGTVTLNPGIMTLDLDLRQLEIIPIRPTDEPIIK